MRVLGALFGNFVSVLQHGQFGHALTIDGAAPFLAGAFDAFVFGQRFDALGIHILGAAVEFGFLGRVFAGMFGTLR